MAKQRRITPPTERFWRFVGERDVAKCWPWLGARSRHGYGNFSVKPGQIIGAHRWSWEMHNGPIPSGLFVCHSCDNKACVNPSHLFIGSHLDNMRDMMAKGRHATTTSYRGEQHRSAKLTREQVRAIRDAFNGGDVTTAELGRRYGVTDVAIGQIVSGRVWRCAL